MPRKPSQILSTLKPDKALVQSATFAFDASDRQYLDDQIRGTQQLVTDNLVNGVSATYALANEDLAPGDVVATAGGGLGVTRYTGELALVGAAPYGIVLAPAPQGARVRVATGGLIGPDVTGFAAGAPGIAKIGTDGALAVVDSLVVGDIPLGTVDAFGVMTLAPKGAIDSSALTLDASSHPPVVAAATGNLTLSGEQPVDDVALISGQRVLAPLQTDKTTNGIYVVGPGPWSRASDANSAALIVGNVQVRSGTTNAGKTFVLVNKDAIVLGTTALRFIVQSTSVDARLLATGDGTTDDTASVMASYLIAPTVSYSAGTYRIATTATIGTYTPPGGALHQTHKFARGAKIRVPVAVTLTLYGNIDAEYDQQCFQIDPPTAASAVTHVGSGPTVTVSGTPTSASAVRVVITTGGALGTSQFTYAINGGPPSSPQATPTSGTFLVPGTGITAALPAGTYVLNDTYSWTTNAGVLIHVPTSGPGVSVCWYGAVADANPNATGTGTDSTAGIQAALSAAGQIPSGTGIVYFPGCNYRVTSSLNIPGGVSLQGDGNGGNEVGTCIQYEGADGTDLFQMHSTPNQASNNRIKDLLLTRTKGFGGTALYIQAWVDGATTRRPSNVDIHNVVSFAANPFGLGVATTIAAGSDGVVLANGAISDVQIASTTGMPSSGNFTVATTAGAVTINYTGLGTSPTRVTGCTTSIGSLTTPTLHTGQAVFNAYRFGRGLYIDGSLLDVAGARGVRATTVYKARFGDCTIPNETVHLAQVTHFTATYLEVDPGPTQPLSNAVGMTIDKGTGTESADVFIWGLECNGNLVLGDSCRDTIIAGTCAGDLTVAGTCADVELTLASMAGSITINSGASGSLRGRWLASPNTTFNGPPLYKHDFLIQVANAPLSCDGMRSSAFYAADVTSGSPQTAHTTTLPTDTTVFVTMHAAARDLGNDDSACWKQELGVECITGATALVGGATIQNAHVLDAIPTADSWNATLGVAGATVTAAVQGKAGRTIRWRVRVTVEAVA